MELKDFKAVKTRDQATAQLRKLGIAKDRYDRFIRRDDREGVFVVDLKLAKAFIADPTIFDDPKAKKPKGPTVSSVCVELILAGKTNAEVWAVVQPQFKLDDGKKGYPSWYRAKLVRDGKLAKAGAE